jgi:hypothetical protein
MRPALAGRPVLCQSPVRHDAEHHKSNGQASRGVPACYRLPRDASGWDANPEFRGAGMTSAREAPPGRGATLVRGMEGRGVNTDRDEPGANSAGSGDWAVACNEVRAAMPPASARDTRMRTMAGPFTSVPDEPPPFVS